MALRAWRVWGVSAVLAAGVVALAQSPRSEVSGRATPSITKDHFQPESGPVPRILPQQVREGNPLKTSPPTSQWNGNLLGPAAPAVDLPALDHLPIGVIRADWMGNPLAARPTSVGEWNACLALSIAEMHFEACELDDARQWYLEVLKRDPTSVASAIAVRRLNQATVIPAGGETREPPLADNGSAGRDIPIP